MTKTNYNSYTSTDFLEDRDFLRYVKYSLPEDQFFWEKWVNSFPENIDEFEAARLQLSGILGDASRPVPADFQDQLWSTINDSIDEAERKEKDSWWRTVAASGSVAAVLIAFALTWYFTSTITIRTDYGQSITTKLPDGSEVRLNANSELSYPRAFNWRNSRLVDLKGEAFFNVKHLNIDPTHVRDGEAFVVNTKDLHVQVLGTEFNVRERRGNINVALLRGKVRVMIHRTGRSYLLSPGASISYDASGVVEQRNDNADIQSAWTSGKIVVRETTVNDIIHSFQDLYGYKVVLEDPAMGMRKIDGEISIRNEESLLFTLKNILNVNIQKKDNTIYLKNRK